MYKHTGDRPKIWNILYKMWDFHSYVMFLQTKYSLLGRHGLIFGFSFLTFEIISTGFVLYAGLFFFN